jgi:type IV secretory pathway TrbD component
VADKPSEQGAWCCVGQGTKRFTYLLFHQNCGLTILSELQRATVIKHAAHALYKGCFYSLLWNLVQKWLIYGYGVSIYIFSHTDDTWRECLDFFFVFGMATPAHSSSHREQSLIGSVRTPFISPKTQEKRVKIPSTHYIQ